MRYRNAHYHTQQLTFPQTYNNMYQNVSSYKSPIIATTHGIKAPERVSKPAAIVTTEFALINLGLLMSF